MRTVAEIAETLPEEDRRLIREAHHVTPALYQFIGLRYFPQSPVLARGVILHIREP